MYAFLHFHTTVYYMKKILGLLLFSSALLGSSLSHATVNPPHLEKCEAGIIGPITEMYSDIWSKKAAFKIGNNFYHLAYETKDRNVNTSIAMLINALNTGATVEILECQGSDINSVRVFYGE